jgi:hypothetical protein
VDPLAADKRALAALLFLAAGTNALDVFSTTNSSPWTAENFGGDPEKVESLRRYVRHAIVLTMGMAILAAVIARSWWPVIGATAAVIYMKRLYEQAIAKGMQSGSTSWENG